MAQEQQKMENKKILYISIGVAALIVSALMLINNDKIIGNDEATINDKGFGNDVGQVQQLSAYDDTNKVLKQTLEESGISMSSPIKLQREEDIKKYCSFFTSEDKQKLVQYCTSTELKDSAGNFLGNIHMVGSPDTPKIILVLVQVDPFMSQLDSVKTIINATIQNTVCDCWNQVHPGNLQNIGDWIDGLKQFHLQDTKPHSRSNELMLNGKTLQLELTTNKDGYLWQFFIYA